MRISDWSSVVCSSELWTVEGIQMRRDGGSVNSLELLRLCPTQILEPGMHRVVLDGPTYRRSFVDWGVFHVEHSFMSLWKRYRRALKQRNHLLRSRRGEREIAAWESELAETGEALNVLRRDHLQSIAGRVNLWIQTFLDEGQWSFNLAPGWKADISLREAIAQHRTRARENRRAADRERGGKDE